MRVAMDSSIGGLTHLKEVQETGVGKAALKYAVLPLGAIAGSYVAGWATDRYFSSRRAPVTCLLLICLAGLSLAYDSVARTSVPATMLLLVLIGFCIYGPQVLLVGTAPADLAKRGDVRRRGGVRQLHGIRRRCQRRLRHRTDARRERMGKCDLSLGSLGTRVGDCGGTTLERDQFARDKRLIAADGEGNHMRAIIIGAGRGSRLMPTTADSPKCFAEVAGRRILDWTLAAFQDAGIRDVVFIGGYQIDKLRSEYPQFTFRNNTDWKNNNILVSLLHAEDVMDEPFLCCYSDVLFTGDIVQRIATCDEDIALAVDTDWLKRYESRTEHPSDDAEKVTVRGGVIERIHREIPEADAYGEFIGLAKFSPGGATALRDLFHLRRESHSGRRYREAAVFEKAYLIHLLQDMIECGQQMVNVDTPGGYIEVDTQQDFEYARSFWESHHLHR